jgi:pentatricopeptide repeat protein
MTLPHHGQPAPPPRDASVRYGPENKDIVRRLRNAVSAGEPAAAEAAVAELERRGQEVDLRGMTQVRSSCAYPTGLVMGIIIMPETIPSLTLLYYHVQVMQAYITRGDAAGAEAALERMLRRGLKPDIVPYGMLLKLHAAQGDVDAAEAWFERAGEAGLARDARLFAGLMRAYAVAKDAEGAEGVLYRMAASGVPPNAPVYNLLLRT